MNFQINVHDWQVGLKHIHVIYTKYYLASAVKVKLTPPTLVKRTNRASASEKAEFSLKFGIFFLLQNGGKCTQTYILSGASKDNLLPIYQPI